RESRIERKSGLADGIGVAVAGDAHAIQMTKISGSIVIRSERMISARAGHKEDLELVKSNVVCDVVRIQVSRQKEIQDAVGDDPISRIQLRAVGPVNQPLSVVGG